MTSEPPTTVPGRARQCPCAGGRGLEWKVYGNICVAREEGARRYIWLSWSWARHARQSGPVGGEKGVTLLAWRAQRRWALQEGRVR